MVATHPTATPSAQKRRRSTAERSAASRKLRDQAAELDTRALHLTQTIASLDGERLRLFTRAERLRWQAEEIEK